MDSNPRWNDGMGNNGMGAADSAEHPRVVCNTGEVWETTRRLPENDSENAVSLGAV